MMLHAPTDALCEIDAARACAEALRRSYARLGGSGLFTPLFLPEIGSRAWGAARGFLAGHLRAQWV